jgi:NAD(P)-dependent dehydrogenase (short-subunit alcohol dehydrogenase family)
MRRLEGRVALICGASPNNGGTIAHFMAKEGAAIAVSDLVPEVAEETAAFLRSRGFEAVAVPGDAANEEDARCMVERTVERFGHLDILVNLAGKQYRWHVLDINPHDWNRVIGSYLTGGMFMTKHAARAMVEKERAGAIIHIVSDAGHQGEPGNSGYSAAKAGLLNFARAAAMDLAPYGIRVNTISPTYIEHNLWRFGEGGWRTLRTRYRTTADDFLRGIPLGRFCRATDLAHAAVYLASDEASFVTGADLPLDGGARAKYWPWVPGEYTGITVEEYARSIQPTRYGEPVDS